MVQQRFGSNGLTLGVRCSGSHVPHRRSAAACVHNRAFEGAGLPLYHRLGHLASLRRHVQHGQGCRKVVRRVCLQPNPAIHCFLVTGHGVPGRR